MESKLTERFLPLVSERMQLICKVVSWRPFKAVMVSHQADPRNAVAFRRHISHPGLVSAQGMVIGKWSGSVNSPFGSTNQFTYSVAGSADSLSISVEEAAGAVLVSFSDIRLVGDTLRFTWPVGPVGAGLACSLLRQESGAFEGICTDLEGREGRMRMVPPAKHQRAKGRQLTRK